MSFLDKLFGFDRPAQPNDEANELLITVHGNEELAAVEALLRSAEIPYRLLDRGAGGVVRVISGYTMYGTDVFVRPEDIETARELLTPVELDENGEIIEAQEAESEETEA
jgi:hypothetical protein